MIVAGFAVLLAGCAPAGVELNFRNQKQTVVLEGASADVFCNPTFKNQADEELAWDAAFDTAETFHATHCPHISREPGVYIRHFSYYTDTGTFQEQNPGGYTEFGLYTDDDIDTLERESTKEPHDEYGLTVWTTCVQAQQAISDTLSGRTLTCTHYRKDYPLGDTTQPPETYSLVPSTDCFVPLKDDLYLGVRIPMAAMDSGANGCSMLKEWGVQSVRLK